MSTTDGDASPASVRGVNGDTPADPIPTSPAIQRLVDGGLLVCLAVLVALIATGCHGPIRVVMAFIFAMLAPGWVVTGYWGSLPLYSRVLASVGSSIGIGIAVTSIALWSHTWHPLGIFIVLVVPVSGALLWRFWHPRGQEGVGGARVQDKALAEYLGVFEAQDSLLVIAFLLWGIGVATTNLSRSHGAYGLIAALAWPFWAGLGFLLLFVAIQIHKSVLSPLRLGFSATTFVFMLQAPVALLYPGPLYVWSAKTAGEVLYDNLHGALNTNLDIYQRWPGFFGLMAWFDHIAGVANPVSYLVWSPLFFDLFAVAAFGFAVNALPMTTRERWLAVFLFFAGDWVETGAQNIFTPQALGFPLALIVLGLALRWYRVQSAPVGLERWRRRLAGFRPLRVLWRDDEVVAPRAEGSRPSLWGIGDRKRFALVLMMFVPLVFAHPLSPYVVVLELGALTVVNRIRPIWLVAVLGAIAVVYLAPNLSFLSSRHENITGPAGLVQNAGPPVVGGLIHLGPNHIAIPAITLALYGLAGLGAFYRWRHRRDVRTMAVLAVTPLLLIGLVHYGSETLYRSLLFATPWAACLGASAIWPVGRKAVVRPHDHTRRHSPVSIRIGATFLTTAILAVLCIVISNSQDEFYSVSPSDLASAQWLNGQKPGVAIYLNTEFPARIGDRYDRFLSRYENDVGLGGYGYYPQAPIQSIIDYACGQTWGDETTTYVVLNGNQATYAVDEGYARAGFLQALEKKLGRSRAWRLVYRNHTDRIYRGPSDCHHVSR